jgi:hypothetical protein
MPRLFFGFASETAKSKADDNEVLLFFRVRAARQVGQHFFCQPSMRFRPFCSLVRLQCLKKSFYY